jgi:hypothetical protein
MTGQPKTSLLSGPTSATPLARRPGETCVHVTTQLAERRSSDAVCAEIAQGDREHATGTSMHASCRRTRPGTPFCPRPAARHSKVPLDVVAASHQTSSRRGPVYTGPKVATNGTRRRMAGCSYRPAAGAPFTAAVAAAARLVRASAAVPRARLPGSERRDLWNRFSGSGPDRLDRVLPFGIVCSRLLGVHDHLLVSGVLLKNVKKARDRGPSL